MATESRVRRGTRKRTRVGAHPLAKPQFTAVVYPGENTREWVAHCLELDIVTQGGTPREAVRMLADALDTVARENLRSGRAFLWEFRPAPAEAWAMLDAAVPMGMFALGPLRPPRRSHTRFPVLSPEIASWSLGNAGRRDSRAGKAR